MRFRNREEAAERLAVRLARYRSEHPLVLSVPRGAVPMGKILAEALDGDLDVVLVHKLGAPGNPELAIGAVSETGDVQVSDFAREMGVSQDYIDRETERQLSILRQRRRAYSAAGDGEMEEGIDPAGRTVIVVDDGVATGATLTAALRWLRSRKPRKLIAAVAVAPTDTARKIAAEVDELVCLAVEELFFAVGQFFENFREVSDAEVRAILAEPRKRTRTAVAAS